MNGLCALVTGGAKGIGASIVRDLAEAGYHVYLNYRTSCREATALAEELCAHNLQVSLLQGDVSQSHDADAMMEQIERDGHQIDLLVNNAGVALQELIQFTTEQQWDTLFGTNAKGVFLMSRGVLPGMIRRQSGNIINISSVWGQCGASFESVYAASKAAVIGLTKSMAKELGPSGIRVNCIAPGVIETDMTGCLSTDTMNELAEDTPLGRNGIPSDISKLVLFLASENSSFITGQVIGVNGGFLI